MSNNRIFCGQSIDFLAYSTGFFVLNFIGFPDQGHAQIVPDATLPVNSNVTQQGNTSVINGGTRAGTNLFHSFREFSIPTNGTAYFNNAAGVQNILTRVTGSSLSNIDGLVRANGTANLFLINPNGIVFGPNASLNIGGSFLASTASQINFADGTQFNATSPQTTPLLTVSVPMGLQMGQNPGKIVVQGPGNNITRNQLTLALIRDNRSAGLEVQNKTLALVGGEIELIGGNLTADGGRIELGSVADNSTVSLTATDNGWGLGYTGVEEFRDIQLKAAASLDSSGNGGGEIQVQGRSISLSEGSAIMALTLGNQPGRDVTLRASENVTLSGSNPLNFTSALTTEVFPGATSNAGNLSVETSRLTILDGAVISSSTFGQGNAGNLTVRASESLKLSGLNDFGFGSGLITQVSLGAIGNAGNLIVETGQLTVSDGAVISSSTVGQGNGGDLTVRASESVLLSGFDRLGTSSNLQAQVFGVGNAGNLTVETGQLTILDGAVISSSTAGQGNAGNLTIRASESVQLSGFNRLGTGSNLQTQVFGVGNAGNLTVETGQLTISDGAVISSSTAGQGNAGNLTIRASESVQLSGFDRLGVGSNLQTQVSLGAIGNAGNLIVETGQLTISDGAFISSSTAGRGNGGNLTVRASESVQLSGFNPLGVGSNLQTQVSLGAIGNAGNLIVETGQLTISDGAGISSSTVGQGNAGNLTIRASESVQLSGFNPLGVGSNLQTQVFGAGNAGNLIVETGQLTISDGAGISSSTFGQGNGGNLSVRATESMSLDGLNASGIGSSLGTVAGTNARGDAGNLTVQTPRLILSDKALISSETFGNGNAGDLVLVAEQLILRDGTQISVSAKGEFSAGTLTVKADDIQLDDRARLLGETESGSQGNINVSANSLILRRSSSITTNAIGAATGGNININTGTLAALENSDISANSQQAQGGTVTINAQAIFGSVFRSREELESLLNTSDPALLDPAKLPSSDITASGANSSLGGTVAINTPEVDPNAGLLQLPENPIDAAQLIASACNRPGAQQSEFTVTGRGGLPPNPYEAIAEEATWIDLRPIAPELSNREQSHHSSLTASSISNPQLIEAQAWVINSQGQVELVAQVPALTPQTPRFIPQQCHE